MLALAVLAIESISEHPRAISDIPLREAEVQYILNTNVHVLTQTENMPFSLEGKIAIVTGASRLRGIGAQIAYELAKRGAKVSGEQGNLWRPS